MNCTGCKWAKLFNRFDSPCPICKRNYASTVGFCDYYEGEYQIEWTDNTEKKEVIE